MTTATARGRRRPRSQTSSSAADIPSLSADQSSPAVTFYNRLLHQLHNNSHTIMCSSSAAPFVRRNQIKLVLPMLLLSAYLLLSFNTDARNEQSMTEYDYYAQQQQQHRQLRANGRAAAAVLDRAEARRRREQREKRLQRQRMNGGGVGFDEERSDGGGDRKLVQDTFGARTGVDYKRMAIIPRYVSYFVVLCLNYKLIICYTSDLYGDVLLLKMLAR